MDLKKRLLAVSWVMPPIVFPRSIQISRTIAELKKRGWTTRVVSSAMDSFPQAQHDEQFGAHYAHAYEKVSIEPRENIERSSPFTRWLRRLLPPSDVTQANWRRRAISASIHEIDTWQPDALVTFAQPWIDHEIGLAIAGRRPGTPWLAHFSDPWVDSPYYQKTPPAAGTMNRWREQERAVAERASGLVFTTEETKALVMGKYPANLSSKAHVTPHGYDSSLLRLVAPEPQSPKPLRIVYCGDIYEGMREPSTFLAALNDLHAELDLTDLVEVEFIGAAPDSVKQAASALPIGTLTKFRGRVGYIESLQGAANADLLLLMDAPAARSVFLPSKIVDYFMLDKPILGLTSPDGAAARLLLTTKHETAAPDDRTAIKSALRSLLERVRSGRPIREHNQSNAIADFSIERTTASFESALLNAVERQRAAS